MSFSDPDAVARYAQGPIRQVPGFQGMQQMARLLLAERVPDDGHVLVLGAGGGLELKAFADAQPGWRFTGVDPSAEMLKLATTTLGPLASRAALV
jgi:tRNA (cmo5U34)-methyltransferase